MTVAKTPVEAATAAANVPSLAKLAVQPEDIPTLSELPILPEEVNAEWLSKVLGCQIKTVSLDRTIPGTATKVFVSVTYEDEDSVEGLPRRFCVKGGFDPSFIKSMPWIVMIYQRECDFYNHVAPKLDNMDLPQSWWAGHNATQGRSAALATQPKHGLCLACSLESSNWLHYTPKHGTFKHRTTLG
jgi:hypothetical protein